MNICCISHLICFSVQATNLSSFDVLGSICISQEGRGWCEALLSWLAVFTITLCHVYVVRRQNSLIIFVLLRSML